MLKRIRDPILFFVGLGAFLFEVANGGERPTILILAAAMMGLPAFLKADESRQQRDVKDEDHDDDRKV